VVLTNFFNEEVRVWWLAGRDGGGLRRLWWGVGV
jgi:hypothetical protein